MREREINQMTWLDNARGASVTLNWLHGDTARSIASVVKEYGGRMKRVAQERRALGYCKMIVTFDRHPGWATNVETLKKFKERIIADGHTNQLTF